MVKKNDGGYGKEFEEYTVYHPIIKELFGTDQDLPDYVTTAHKIDPFFRVKMQGTIQKYIDSSISSTVNLREDIPIETVADIYTTAYDNGLKGITVYREGSREGILITNDDKEKDKNKEIDTQSDTQVKETTDKKPRIRPTQTQGLTRRIKTGEGTLYITINEDERGLCEVFTTIGKAGGNAAAQSEAISRLISLALRSGINPQSIVRQLKGISGPNPTWEDGRLILSTPDAIGKALDDYLHEKEQSGDYEQDAKLLITMDTDKDEKKTPDHEGEVILTAASKLMMCPSCESRSVVNEGGCLTCQSCGWSKCD
jgi:ribonucleoside-diphosphate reductase alpha chain